MQRVSARAYAEIGLSETHAFLKLAGDEWPVVQQDSDSFTHSRVSFGQVKALKLNCYHE